MNGKDHQGGKAFGVLKQEQEKKLDEINQSFINTGDYDDEEEWPDLEGSLNGYKKQFMEFDEDNSGDIDIMELKRMMEKLGQAKTHLELKKMIAEVDTTNSGTITYEEFLLMMLGKKSSILKKILMFEALAKEKERPTGIPPKRDLASLP
ncbi:allograft inflammatory factor 1-like [Xenia sp. Carnegie-2017]|uniref:allograft inflammatory factor 1-like n=1 Tax=Xenia sp. Carnegie-2017 TaxID=2897299 RepID=UPI001F03682A|nr:allograft inflammatory factor 1-like [Xenia sp. Carnegie-2017]